MNAYFAHKRRDVGDGSPLFLFGKDDSDKVYEFKSSPFVRYHLKCSRNISFVHKKKEYIVGDFVETKDDESIYRIASLFYEKKENLNPKLVIRALQYEKALYFSRKHRLVLQNQRLNEIVCINETKTFHPDYIQKKVMVIANADELLPHDYTCGWLFEDGKLKPHSFRETALCNEFVTQGKTSVYNLTHAKTKFNNNFSIIVQCFENKLIMSLLLNTNKISNYCFLILFQ